MKHLASVVAISFFSLVAYPNIGFAKNIQKVAESTTGSSFYIDTDSIKRDYIGNIAFMSYEKAPGRNPEALFVQGSCTLKTAGINGSNPQLVLTGTIISKLLNVACAVSE